MIPTELRKCGAKRISFLDGQLNAREPRFEPFYLFFAEVRPRENGADRDGISQTPSIHLVNELLDNFVTICDRIDSKRELLEVWETAGSKLRRGRLRV